MSPLDELNALEARLHRIDQAIRSVNSNFVQLLENVGAVQRDVPPDTRKKPAFGPFCQENECTTCAVEAGGKCVGPKKPSEEK